MGSDLAGANASSGFEGWNESMAQPSYADSEFASGNEMGSGAEASQSGGALATGQHAAGNTSSFWMSLLESMQSLSEKSKRKGTTGSKQQLGIPAALGGGGAANPQNVPPLNFGEILTMFMKASGAGGK